LRAYNPYFKSDHFSGGGSQSDWTPQFNYWRRPEKLDDGGENVRN